jgi:hypothetical protein
MFSSMFFIAWGKTLSREVKSKLVLFENCLARSGFELMGPYREVSMTAYVKR